MNEIVCSVGELRALIRESSNEFKAKLGDGVENGNKRINDKSYEDSMKRTKDYNGGLTNQDGGKRAKYEKNDYNGTTLDYQPQDASDAYKKRVKAQVLGYTSEAEMNNKIDKAADFEGNKAIYDGIKKSGEEMHDEKEDECKKGLVGRVRPENYFDRDSIYENKDSLDMRKMIENLSEKTKRYDSSISENRKYKTVKYKKTEFLSESHMLSRVPDNMKNEGEMFVMKDKNDSEYLVEWRNNSGHVLSHTNKKGMNESMNRMKELMGYKSSEHTEKSDINSRIDESSYNFEQTLDRARKIRDSK